VHWVVDPPWPELGATVVFEPPPEGELLGLVGFELPHAAPVNITATATVPNNERTFVTTSLLDSVVCSTLRSGERQGRTCSLPPYVPDRPTDWLLRTTPRIGALIESKSSA
jgi:hypothetical protein